MCVPPDVSTHVDAIPRLTQDSLSSSSNTTFLNTLEMLSSCLPQTHSTLVTHSQPAVEENIETYLLLLLKGGTWVESIRESSYFPGVESCLYRAPPRQRKTAHLPGRKPPRQPPSLLPPRAGSVGRSQSLERLAAVAKWLLQRQSVFAELLTSGN